MTNFTAYTKFGNFKFIENSLPFENSINFKRSIDISNSNNNEYEKLYIYIVLEKYNLNQSAHLAIEFHKQDDQFSKTKPTDALRK